MNRDSLWRASALAGAMKSMNDLQREVTRALLWGEEPDDEGLAFRYGTSTVAVRRERFLAYRRIRELTERPAGRDAHEE